MGQPRSGQQVQLAATSRERREPGAWNMSPVQVVSSFSSDTMRAFRGRRITPATQVDTDA